MISELYLDRLQQQHREEKFVNDLSVFAGIVGFVFIFTVACL